MKSLHSFTAPDGTFAIGYPFLSTATLCLQIRDSAPIPFETPERALKEYMRLAGERVQGGPPLAALKSELTAAMEEWDIERAVEAQCMASARTPDHFALCACLKSDCPFSNFPHP